MKNIHVLPTDKPSRLYKTGDFLLLDSRVMPNNTLETKNQNIYITSGEEIKVGDWVLNSGDYDEDIVFKADESFFGTGLEAKKIILTTDPKLIKDGVQSIDDEFLEWFVKNPSCEEVEVKSWIKTYEDGSTFDRMDYEIIIPKEEPKNICIQTGLPCGMQCLSEEACNSIRLKQKTLEEAASKVLYNKYPYHPPQDSGYWKDMFKEGAKWQQERMYSEEEVNEIIAEAWNSCEDNEGETFTEARKRIIEQFKNK